MRLKTLVIHCALFLLLIAQAAHADLRPIVATDLLKIRSISSIDVAADGARAVFAVRSTAAEAGKEHAWSYRSHLYLVELGLVDSEPRQITFGDRNDRSPQLSPDGRRVAFVRGDEDTPGRSQVWVMSVDGGEARQVTSLKHGASSPRWSPDGKSLLVSSSLPMSEIDGSPLWPSERPRRSWNDANPSEEIIARPDGSRAEIRAWLEQNARETNPFVITRLDFQEEQRLRGEMRFEHLYLVDSENGQVPPRRLTAGFYDHQEAQFMPDGRRVVYAAKKPTDQHPDRVRTRDLWMVNADGTNDRMILAMDSVRLGTPLPSRDGAVLAFIGQKQDEPAFRQSQLGMVQLGPDGAAVGEPVWLTDESSFDSSVRSPQWMPARAAILFTSARQGGFPLMMMSQGLPRPTAVVEEHHGMPLGVHAFGVGGGAIVYSQTSAVNPCVLRVRDGRSDRLLMDLNAWTAEKELSIPSGGWITRPDGTRVQYWLMEPTRPEQGKKYPLVLQIHGGPSAMWGPGEASMWHEFQLFCSWGYGVVYANPRGSGGYGYAFQRANYQNWGDGPAGDVLAAVDQALLQEWVDRDRLVITGGSYAGYLTAWIIAHDHRFKAAVAQRGVYHLPTFFGEGNAWRLVPWAMGGAPFDSRFRQIIDRESPFTYVSRIRTPLLIKHGSEDLRTGVSQSEMLYRALKHLDRPVEYVRYPGAGHDMSRTGPPKQRMDRLNRIIEFFERHIENPRPAPRPD